MTDRTDDPTNGAEVDRLKTKIRELLAEGRQAKDRIQHLTEQVTAQAERLNRYEVDAPLRQIIGDVAMPGAEEPFMATLAQYLRFGATDAGQLVIRDLQGEPVKLPAVAGKKGREVEREARATVEDLRAIVDLPELRAKFAAITVGSRASGGGAGGSSPGGAPRETRKLPQEQRPEPKLGLR